MNTQSTSDTPERLMRITAALLLVLASCAAGPDTTPDAGDTSGTADAGNTSGKYTLDTCTTSIADGTPAFFKRYFRCVTVTHDGTSTRISSTGKPPHDSPYYASSDPNHVAWDTSRGSAYHQNPNTLSAKAIAFTIPDAPTLKDLTITESLVDLQARTSTLEYSLGPVGIALDGTALFNSTAAPGDDIANERFTFDLYEGHPSPDGQYHYHAASPGPLEVLAKAGLTTSTTPTQATVELYGIMCDGTPVLGCTELDGTARPATGLDAQGGHVTDLKDTDGTLLWASRYHTHACTKDGGFTYTPEIQRYTTCTK